MATEVEPSRAELIALHEELHVHIRATEEWNETYKKSPKAFADLLLLEAQLETAVAEYLHAAAGRAPGYVDWSRLPDPVEASVNADAGPVENNDSQVWLDEEKLLTAAVLQIITDLIAAGGQGAEELYGIPVGYTNLNEAIMEAARKHVAQFVRGATETTRKLIRESVARSIAMGEDAHASTLRLMNVIDNPIRAELIAQTEPVNAYQRGYYMYAKETGAKSKEWDGLAGACSICTPLIGTTIPIDDKFILANGKEVDHPAGHPRCRCSLIYNY